MRHFVFQIAILLVAFSSCKKDNDFGPQCVECPDDTLNTEIQRQVFIINEGNFGWGNSSLSLYDAETQAVQNQVFQSANGAQLGDISFSLEIIDSLGYIVVNNSSKIEVIDMNSLTSVATITGFNTPRYILKVAESKAYVTSLFGDKIYIVDLISKQISGEIELNGWSEQLILANNEVYILNRDRDNIVRINPNTDSIIDSIAVGVEPNSMILDNENNLWILCSGGFQEANATLVQVSISTNQVVNSFTFSNISHSPNSLCFNSITEKLYFLNEDVFVFSIKNDQNLPTNSVIKRNGRLFYSVNVDSDFNEIYVTDAVDYVQEGMVYRYNNLGIELNNFKAGIIPGNIVFYQK